MATPQDGKGQETTTLISQGPRKAQVVLTTTYPDGRRTSRTVHYRVQGGQFVSNARVVGGRGTQKEDGKPKAKKGRF